ncbi:MAG: hypothetical protein ABSE55_14130 [Terracidiphilus sp.]|jgi:hypothetical protein
MEGFAGKVLLLILGAIVVEVTRQIVDYVKRITPRVEYSSLSGLPVDVDDKHFCSYRIKIKNPSKKKVEDVTFHIRASKSLIKTEVISKPEGLEYNLIDKDDGVDLTFPYLKHDEEVVLKAQVEGRYYYSDSLSISVTSPNDLEAKAIPYEVVQKSSISRTLFVFIAGFIFASVLFFGWIWKINTQPSRNQTNSAVYAMDRRDIVISAASAVGLPHIAELYFTAPEPKYFEEGDIAYSFAAASNNPQEIMKYRKLISLTLGSEPTMLPESQASLFYSLGKLDLLASDGEGALSDFRNATLKSRAIVEAKAKMDAKTHEFLIDKGLL